MMTPVEYTTLINKHPLFADDISHLDQYKRTLQYYRFKTVTDGLSSGIMGVILGGVNEKAKVILTGDTDLSNHSNYKSAMTERSLKLGSLDDADLVELLDILYIKDRKFHDRFIYVNKIEVLYE